MSPIMEEKAIPVIMGHPLLIISISPLKEGAALADLHLGAALVPDDTPELPRQRRHDQTNRVKDFHVKAPTGFGLGIDFFISEEPS
jgi:hypothetical protein